MPRPVPLRSRNADALDLAEILRDLAEFVFLYGADVRGTCQALFGAYIYELASRSRLNDRPLSGLLREYERLRQSNVSNLVRPVTFSARSLSIFVHHCWS